MILGQHHINLRHLRYYYTIPVIDTRNPPNAWLQIWRPETHDIAMLILKEPAIYSHVVQPICLPHPNAEFSGKMAKAAGWGRYTRPQISTRQSPILRTVWLRVSPKKYHHFKMFGTVLSKKDGLYQDPCSGDSGKQ